MEAKKYLSLDTLLIEQSLGSLYQVAKLSCNSENKRQPADEFGTEPDYMFLPFLANEHNAQWISVNNSYFTVLVGHRQ